MRNPAGERHLYRGPELLAKAWESPSGAWFYSIASAGPQGYGPHSTQKGAEDEAAAEVKREAAKS
jgi:hypothetical protein